MPDRDVLWFGRAAGVFGLVLVFFGAGLAAGAGHREVAWSGIALVIAGGAACGVSAVLFLLAANHERRTMRLGGNTRPLTCERCGTEFHLFVDEDIPRRCPCGGEWRYD